VGLGLGILDRRLVMSPSTKVVMHILCRECGIARIVDLGDGGKGCDEFLTVCCK
jgi:hypothetical protein